MENKLVPKPRRRFIRVKCNCGNEQTMFEAASSVVKCLVCNQELAEPGASKINLKAKIVKVYE